MTEDFNNSLKKLDRYRSAAHADIFLQACVQMGYLTSVDDFYTDTQDRKCGLTSMAGKRGTRYVEEMTVYDCDGTMLGSMTLSVPMVEPRWNIPAWLTPVYIHTSVTREDLIRQKKNPLP